MSATNMNDTPTTPKQSVTFFGKMLTFSRLKLNTDDLSVVEAHLNTLISNKNSHIPVVIDSDVTLDLPALVELLWQWGLQPIGVVTGVLDEQATAQRLAIFPADGKRIERIVPKKSTQPPSNQATQTPSELVGTDTTTHTNNTDDVVDNMSSHTVDVAPHLTQAANNSVADHDHAADHITSLVYDQMLRSGQSINHVGGDLILTNSINNGAEAITDNSLHIYGRAQGRLVAGATGDKDARIFCQSFNPTLVSVAGTYCLRDNIPADVIDKPVQVRYEEGEGLIFTVMNNY